MSLTNLAMSWTEQGLVPDAAIRAGIRRLLRQRKQQISAADAEAAAIATEAFIAAMDKAPSPAAATTPRPAASANGSFPYRLAARIT